MVSRKLIDELFASGNSRSMAAFPLRAIYMSKVREEHESPIQLLVSVPKKHFHHAVDRNRVKRQIREAFRLHKQQLAQQLPPTVQLLLAFVWLSDRHLPTADIESRVVSLLQRIAEKQKSV
jgi:ribonuclease P protein component